MEVQNFARPGVDQRQVSFWGGRSDTGKIPAIGVNLLKQAVAVLSRSFLPFAIGIGKIELAVQPFLDSAPVGHR